MPPITPVPIECRLAAPAPELTARGTAPRMKAAEVITIGRKRSVAPLTAASAVLSPRCRWRVACGPSRGDYVETHSRTSTCLGELAVSVSPGDRMVSNRLAGHVECQPGIEFC